MKKALKYAVAGLFAIGLVSINIYPVSAKPKNDGEKIV